MPTGALPWTRHGMAPFKPIVCCGSWKMMILAGG
jgi:hypothetical protein